MLYSPFKTNRFYDACQAPLLLNNAVSKVLFKTNGTHAVLKISFLVKRGYGEGRGLSLGHTYTGW